MYEWKVIYSVEREVVLRADNINDVYEKADEGKREGERIVSIRCR